MWHNRYLNVNIKTKKYKYLRNDQSILTLITFLDRQICRHLQLAGSYNSPVFIDPNS